MLRPTAATTGALGLPRTRRPPCCAARGHGDDGFLGALHARGLRPHEANARAAVRPRRPPGASESFDVRARRAARGGRAGRAPDRRRPAGLRARDRGQAPRPRKPADVELPAPLAEPRLDFRVDRASALAYEVQEGEYIQVIDVQGRQCSDFLAFHETSWRSGLERGMDGVTTRTLMGAAYPLPGPLQQVLRRGHGPAGAGGARHGRPPRQFGLACTRAYYEDLGYPGHVNCTDNFNEPGDAVRHRVAPGWEAVNFFYNTRVEARPPARHGRALVAARRLRAAAGADATSSARRRRAPTTSTRRTRGSPPTSTCASTRPRTASRRPSPIA